jgi:hypothetical protein
MLVIVLLGQLDACSQVALFANTVCGRTPVRFYLERSYLIDATWLSENLKSGAISLSRAPAQNGTALQTTA